MNQALNTHLVGKYGEVTKDCEDFTAAELQKMQTEIYQMADPELLKVYAEIDTDLPSSGRQRTAGSMADLQASFNAVPATILADPALHAVYRDGLCHQTVMWFVHHLSASSRQELVSKDKIPLLPHGQHDAPANPTPEQAQVHGLYDAQTTCQACHVGGIPDLGVPEKKPTTKLQLARRCYTNYKDLYGITCGPCDGIAGQYWGDNDDTDFLPDPCVIVGTPDDIPAKDRVFAAFPPQFSVFVEAGSDRWGRTTNPGPIEPADTLGGPPVIASMYGQISGRWYTDIMPDSDLWLLRHDTHYGNVSFNGTKTTRKFDVSEIHSQTTAQQKVNNTGPMVSLIDGIPDIIPGGCTCVADPVGVPDVAHERTDGLGPDAMQFLGRINITLLELSPNDPSKAPTYTVDHWANWFFHVFMNVDKADPAYGRAPRRLCSAYAGTATYDHWVFGDPAVAEKDIWKRGIPTKPEIVGPDVGKYCGNPQKIDMCSDISQDTFPPKPEKSTRRANEWAAVHKLFKTGLY